MYKTIKHGENSLQYKILSQQEDGLGNIKCTKSKRSKTAGILTILLLLACGVIATAVLVPLILTNDFITLTGTFQKFSVSTLRRSHNGNHVVVIAKKPHGWNSSRHSVLPSNTKVVQMTVHNFKPKTTFAGELSLMNDQNNVTRSVAKTTKSVSEAIKTTTITIKTTTAATKTKDVPTEASVMSASQIKSTQKAWEPIEGSTGGRFHQDSNIEQNIIKPNLSQIQQEQNIRREFVIHENPATKIPPSSWYDHQNWNLEAPNSFIAWSKNRLSNPLSTTVGGVCAVAVILIMIFVLMKSLPDRKKYFQKNSSEPLEDKASLLKPSARTSDEEC